MAQNPNDKKDGIPLNKGTLKQVGGLVKEKLGQIERKIGEGLDSQKIISSGKQQEVKGKAQQVIGGIQSKISEAKADAEQKFAGVKEKALDKANEVLDKIKENSKNPPKK